MVFSFLGVIMGKAWGEVHRFGEKASTAPSPLGLIPGFVHAHEQQGFSKI